MRKSLLSLVIVVFIIMSSYAICETKTEDTLNSGYQITTNNEIAFNYIPWDCSIHDFEQSLTDIGVVFSKETSHAGNGIIDFVTNKNKPSASFGITGIVETKEFENVPTVTVKYHSINYDSINHDELLSVAGYKVDEIIAKFYESTDQLYEITILFMLKTINNDIVKGALIYPDLRNKLSSLYGYPYSQSKEYMDPVLDGKINIKSCAWVGNNCTAVELQFESNVDTKYGLLDGDFISLRYGKTDSYMRMQDYVLNAEIDENNKQKEAVDKISGDISGL